MHVMVVDDSSAMRMLVKKNLKDMGIDPHDIMEAEDGAKALEKIKSAKPDLVVSDWNMPNMSGLELLLALNTEGIRLKFGFVTTEATQEMRQKAMDAGARFLITKPFTADSFAQGLRAVLK